MTIFFPDVSHYDLDRGVILERGTVAVIVKATHGKLFVDRGYLTLLAQANTVGAYITAYHWLNHGDGAGQARYCWEQLGRIPVMVDAEDQPGNTGYTGPNTVQDILDFASILRDLGGTCHLVYLPKWYWSSRMGSPDLTPLAKAGLHLVSSHYTAYSDDGPGWDSYGGVAPVQWQYTNALPYGGGQSDFNSFKGSLDEYIALTGGDLDMAWTDDQWAQAYQWLQNIEAVVTKEARDLDDLGPVNYVDGNPVEPNGINNPTKLRLVAIQAVLARLAAGGVDLDALAAKLAPKVADELARRLGNG